MISRVPEENPSNYNGVAMGSREIFWRSEGKS